MAPYPDHHHGEHHKLPPVSVYPLLGPDPMALLNYLFVLLTVGQASLLLLLVTLLFSKRISKRNATMLNLVLVSIAATIPQPILYYGKQILDPHPPYSICLAQAVLKHGADPMLSTAALALILEILLQTSTIIWPIRYKISVGMLVALPYVVFIFFLAWALALGSIYPSSVKHVRNDYYCSIALTLFDRGTDIFSMTMVFFSIALEIYAIVKSRRVRMSLRLRNVQPSKVYSKGLYIRVLGFTICQLLLFILLVLDFYFKSKATHVIPIVFEAAMPSITFLIFGSSPDCLAVWKFWGKRSTYTFQPEGPTIAITRAPATPTTIEQSLTTPAISQATTPTPSSYRTSNIYLDVEIPNSSLGPIPYLSDT